MSKRDDKDSAPPDLGDLVRAVVEGPPPAAEPETEDAEPEDAEPEDAKPDDAEPEGTEPEDADSEAEPKEEVSADSDEPTDDDEAPTAEFQPVEQVKSTEMYNPSVDKLIGRLEEVDVISEEESIRARVENTLKYLKNETADLRKTSMEFATAQAITSAEKVCQEVYTLLDLLKEKYPDLIEPRQPLLDGLRVLEGLIEDRRPEPPEETEAKQEQMAEELGINAHQQLARQRRRRTMLVAGVMLLAAGRIAWGVVAARVDQVEPVVKTTKNGVALAANNAAGAREDELKVGAPSVVELSLAQLRDGTLQAQVLAFDPDGQRLFMTYRWYEDGKLITTTEQNELRAGRVKRSHRYHVRVTANDGRNFSDPVSTPPLLTKRGAWRPATKQNKKGPAGPTSMKTKTKTKGAMPPAPPKTK